MDVRHSLLLVSVAAVLFLLGMTATRSAPPGPGFSGSAHDFGRASNANGAIGRTACTFCHVTWNRLRSPQEVRLAFAFLPATGATIAEGDASAAETGPPLWNQASSEASAFYAMYQNGPGAPARGSKASQAIVSGMIPGTTSLLCLSCHDGSIAVNLYGNAIGRNYYLGNHHPIGFDYEAAYALDREIRSPDVATLGTAGVVRDHLYGPGNMRMECGTCHSVHNEGNTGASLLWRSDTRSQLCLTCHDKGINPGLAGP